MKNEPRKDDKLLNRTALIPQTMLNNERQIKSNRSVSSSSGGMGEEEEQRNESLFRGERYY